MGPKQAMNKNQDSVSHNTLLCINTFLMWIVNKVIIVKVLSKGVKYDDRKNLFRRNS